MSTDHSGTDFAIRSMHMLSRREVIAHGLSGSVLLSLPKAIWAKSLRPSVISANDLEFLRELATKTIGSATKADSREKNRFDFVTPGGAYPAFWVRDFSMAAGCGLVSSDTIEHHLKLIARCQQGPKPRMLGDRALIPAFSVPDHVNYDGSPVFFPGTYSPGDDQGGEPFGVVPPADDHFEFIHLAYLLWKKTQSVDFLQVVTGGLTLFDQLCNALDCPTWDQTTGLVVTGAKSRAVGFGFCDCVYLTGSLLFPSLLKYRALGEMIELSNALKAPSSHALWKEQRRQIARNLEPTFLSNGWLIAATGTGRQPDVWGTAYAVYLNVAKGILAKILTKTLVDSTRAEKITYQGAVRHVPTDHDFSATSAWEKTAGVPVNRYQNGAYWHVPTGWLAVSLARTDIELARKLVDEMVRHFRAEASEGAPWECIHPDHHYRNNPIYMASVTLPLEVLQGFMG